MNWKLASLMNATLAFTVLAYTRRKILPNSRDTARTLTARRYPQR
jgi:hypothetical protein